MTQQLKVNTKKIKEALLRGGLVIADRGTGKTQALFEILLERSNVAIVVPTEQQQQRYNDLIQEKFPNVYSKAELSNVIILDSPNTEQKLKGLHRDIYVDEYFLCRYRGPFKAAVTSFPFPVTVIV